MKSSRPLKADTGKLIDELCALGFTDEAYGALHHFRVLRKRRDTMAEHLKYLDDLATDFLQLNKGNHQVQLRLERVLRKFRERGLPAGDPKVFVPLAEEAWNAIEYVMPPRKSARSRSTGAQ